MENCGTDMKTFCWHWVSGWGSRSLTRWMSMRRWRRWGGGGRGWGGEEGEGREDEEEEDNTEVCWYQLFMETIK